MRGIVRALALCGAVSQLPLAAGWVVSSPAAQTASLRAEAHAATRAGAAVLPQAAVAADAQDGRPPHWVRATLAAFAVLATVLVGSSRPAHAEGGQVQLYFGQGCFWHLQHDIVKEEVDVLGRKGGDITALAGYAGGNKVGDKGRVCYHNLAMAPDYGQMGHTEVVNVSMPEDKIGAFAKKYFDDADRYPMGRADPQDRGTEYRSAIGIPGGMDGKYFDAVKAANAGRLELLKGEGNDADTVRTKKVWIYDSDKYPFYQGEVYHQFHDDMLESYSKPYKGLKDTVLKIGSLKKVECPEVGF
jgi:peptide methionine sulfoxide reductase MsrA